MTPTRGTKREAIRVEPDLWREYGAACEALGTNRSADLRALMVRRVKAWQKTQRQDADSPRRDQ